MREGRGKELSQKRRKKRRWKLFHLRQKLPHTKAETAFESPQRAGSTIACCLTHSAPAAALSLSLPVFLSLSVFLSPSKNTLKRKVIKFKQPKNVEKGKNQKKEKEVKKWEAGGVVEAEKIIKSLLGKRICKISL